MKILLTGSNGMVGRNILEHTSALKYSFLTPGRTDLNLLNSEDVLEYFKVHKPTIVIHCAGLVGGIQANMKEPVRFLVENTDMGRNVLMAANAIGVERFINMASSCMYPKDHENLLEEELILSGPLEPTNEGYALAKIFTMKLGQYMNQENQKIIFKTLVPCNLYGRWDKFSEKNSHMVPAVIRKIHKAIQNNEISVEIWGAGNARREFMYASDLADFVFFALENWEKIPETINVGLGADHSINEYYKVVSDILGYKGKFHHDLTKPEGMKRKLVSTKKADDLGWISATTLEIGIKKTYEFFLDLEQDKEKV
ncbi:MAG: NAD-dependent epimerase/dehydratase family protein [Bacteriovorax sp.]|nr:NAD-dependent epimerase/dehydratase family protein [Bacteriovorax sp.]